ncbi:MAG: hypothetical protein WCH05_07900, partial [Chlorobiaceae bacterium]
MPFTQIRSCPICGDSAKGLSFPYSTFFNGVLFRYCKCRSCSSIFVDPVPDGRTFALMYAKANYHDVHYEKQENAGDSPYKESACLLAKFANPGALVLDYGCGSGGFLKALGNAGFVPFGVEFDADAAETAARHTGFIAMSVESFNHLTEKPAFDVLHLGDVLVKYSPSIGQLSRENKFAH